MAFIPTADLIAKPNLNYVWDPGSMTWVKETQPGGSGGGGTSSSFGVAFPATGTAAGAEDPGGNMAPFLVDAGGNLLVNVAAGGTSGVQYNDGAARGAATGTLAMVDDGVNIQSAKGDTDGTLQANLMKIGGAAYSEGQKAMAASAPVVIASDQTSVPISGTVNQGTANTLANAWPVKVTDGTNSPNIKQMSGDPVDADFGLVTMAAIHGHTTAGGGSFVDVKVTPSGAISADIGSYGGTGTSLGQKVMASSVPVTIASNQSAVPVSGSVTATGTTLTASTTLNALGQTLAIDTTGMGTAMFWSPSNVAWNGEISLEGTNDGTNWFALEAIQPTGDIITTTFAIPNGSNWIRLPCSGMTQVRAIVSSYTGGSMVLNASSGPAETPFKQLVGVEDPNSGTRWIINNTGTGAVRLTEVGSQPTAVNAGNADNGTQRVVIASDQPPRSIASATGSLHLTGDTLVLALDNRPFISVAAGVTPFISSGSVQFQSSYDGGTTYNAVLGKMIAPPTIFFYEPITASDHAFATNSVFSFNYLFNLGPGATHFRIYVTSNLNTTMTNIFINASNDPVGDVVTQVTQGHGSAALGSAWQTQLTDLFNGPVKVTPSSTSAIPVDKALVVGLSPNSPLPAGSNALGSVSVSGSVAVTGPLTDAQLRASPVPVTSVGGATAASQETDRLFSNIKLLETLQDIRTELRVLNYQTRIGFEGKLPEIRMFDPLSTFDSIVSSSSVIRIDDFTQ